jgi:carboxymethylenebutenolidase
MKEELIKIPTRDGAIDTFITRPADYGPFPPVFIYMDVWGLREELFDVARRVATVGYYCVVPNFYYRQGPVRHEFRNSKGEMITLDRLPADQKAKVLAPLEKLTDDMVVADTAAILKHIDTDRSGKRGAVGSIGYCMGGRHVFRAAANFPGRFAASASLHGTNLVIEGKDSPHLAMSAARGEVYCGFGERDQHTPNSTVEALERAFAAFAGRRARYVGVVHKGADHGYALPDRDVFDKQAANRDWEIVFAMFRRQLDGIR